MNSIIIVWYDNNCGEFYNDNYDNISKSEAVKNFYNSHNNDAVLINVIDL